MERKLVLGEKHGPEAAGPKPGAAWDQACGRGNLGHLSILGMLEGETAPARSGLGLGPPSRPFAGPKHAEITAIPSPLLFLGQFLVAFDGKSPPAIPQPPPTNPKHPSKGLKTAKPFPAPILAAAFPAAVRHTGPSAKPAPKNIAKSHCWRGGKGVGVSNPPRSDKMQQRG